MKTISAVVSPDIASPKIGHCHISRKCYTIKANYYKFIWTDISSPRIHYCLRVSKISLNISSTTHWHIKKADSIRLKTLTVYPRTTRMKRKVIFPSFAQLIVEGAYYVWTKREFDDILGLDAEIAAAHWNVKPNGNVDPQHDIQGELEEQVSPICTGS